MIIPWPFFLKANEQLLIATPTARRAVNGPGLTWAPPFSRVRKREALVLPPTADALIRDTHSGALRVIVGPGQHFLGVTEEVVAQRSLIPLQRNQYLRLIDRRSGVVRVERGEQSVSIGPTEELLEGPGEGVTVDAATAVLIRDTRTGALELITTPQMFVPHPYQELVEIRQRITLEDHEAVVIKARDGSFVIRRGSDPERAFFLAPYSDLLTFRWSSGIHKERRDLRVTQLDLRPKFMWYEFECRTQDNVELVLGVTFFWQIVDVAQMVRTTDDAPGDICAHARSDIIQAVSQVSLEHFLAAFNEVIGRAVLGDADPFYAERGVVLHAVEVRSVACKDPATQRILLEIIQETTNRLNRLQQQESENEVRLRQLDGEIAAERLRGQLLVVQREVEEEAASIAGAAEGGRVRAFLAGLGADLTPAEKLLLFQTLRKQEALLALSAGQARLVLTPADVDLRIDT